MADPSKMSAKSGGDVYYDDGSDKDLAATLDALLLSAGGTLSRSPPLSSSSSGMPNGEIPLSGDPLPKLLQTPGSEMTLATLMAMLEDPKTQNEISKKDPLEEAFPDTPSGSKAQLDLFDLFDKNAVTPGLDDKKGLIGGEEDTTMVKGASKSNNFAAQNEEEVDVDQDDPVQLQDHPLQFDPQA
ncbi:hypothetical protein CCR75_006674 [Bremia lactucae]|uniref:Uncharacterized protein n=1 Tax=Bremia lactucae TaxID=4779 RepID=A0A976NZ58_BRELC|nr:hypothetical protein CCR75_006674 [Bremia lactucae]